MLACAWASDAVSASPGLRRENVVGSGTTTSTPSRAVNERSRPWVCRRGRPKAKRSIQIGHQRPSARPSKEHLPHGGGRRPPRGTKEPAHSGTVCGLAQRAPPAAHGCPEQRTMPLTRSFRETVVERAQNDVGFRAALIEEAIQAFVDGEMERLAHCCAAASMRRLVSLA